MVTSDLGTGKLITFIGCMASDRLLFDLMYEVYRQKLYLGETNISDADMNIFFKDSKNDLFAVFIEKCIDYTKRHGLTAMITQHSWMFLASYEALRTKIYTKEIKNMAHLGSRGFDEISGEVVQTTSFVLGEKSISGYVGVYHRLVEGMSENEKRELFLSNRCMNVACQNMFTCVPGQPTAYWVGINAINNYKKGRLIGDVALVKKGMFTGENDRFFRSWYEIKFDSIDFNVQNKEEVRSKHYVPMNSGGPYRRWYGNRLSVIKFDKEHYDLITKNKGHRNPQYYFRKTAAWTKITSGNFSIRLCENGFINNDDASMCVYESEVPLESIVALLNSKVAQYYLSLVNESLNYTSGNVASLPYIEGDNDRIYELVNNCIAISKSDWDSFEVSWDFECHPLVEATLKKPELFKNPDDISISDCYKVWMNACSQRFEQIKTFEEERNKIYIDLYELRDELSPEIDEKNITVRKADLNRDIRSLVSYAVGCMFGRYSISEPGLIFTGGLFDDEKYQGFQADKDGIIPITDEQYFDDDIVERFVEFIQYVFGSKSLERNLEYIADGLGTKGTSAREKIRNYFLNEFYKDHCNIYSGLGKRPIYWLFDSGKHNGFKCLIYLHRYNPEMIGVIRSDYLTKAQSMIENALKNAEYAISTSASAVDRAQATKKRDKYIKQLAEIRAYYPALSHIALQRINLDLDDGVKLNYEKFQNIEVSIEGEKKQKIDLLAKI